MAKAKSKSKARAKRSGLSAENAKRMRGCKLISGDNPILTAVLYKVSRQLRPRNANWGNLLAMLALIGVLEETAVAWGRSNSAEDHKRGKR